MKNKIMMALACASLLATPGTAVAADTQKERPLGTVSVWWGGHKTLLPVYEGTTGQDLRLMYRNAEGFKDNPSEVTIIDLRDDERVAPYVGYHFKVDIKLRLGEA